jgi:hypothetical protein
MAAAGVGCLARTGEQLTGYLRQLGRPGPAREAQLRAAAPLFATDAAMAVTQVGLWGAPPQPRLRRVARVVRTASTAALVGAMSWVGLTTGVGVAAAAGAGVAHPPAGLADTVYLGVRLGQQELDNPAVQEALLSLDASAVVDVCTAEVEPVAVRELSSLGVDLESGGLGYGPGTTGEPSAPWTLARSDSLSVHVLSAIAGRPVNALVPDHSLSAFDLVDAGADHLMMVVPNTTLPVAPSGPFPQQVLALPQLQPDQIYVVNGKDITASQLLALLHGVGAQLAASHLAIAPLSVLR